MENSTLQEPLQGRNKVISEDEAKAVATFLGVVNTIIRGNDNKNPISETTALKFLFARKFDVDRALELYRLHEITRHREELANIDMNDGNLKSELDSGKFTILNCRGPNECAIAIFTAKLHSPVKSSKNNELRKKVHRYTLQGIVYQLDAALDAIDTQRNGIIFIYNMSDSDYSNFDYELCQKILNLLKGAYPAKLKKVLIVSPPLWFRAPFHLLRLIVREKLRDRVTLLNKDHLQDHIPRDALTPELGGEYSHDHHDWLSQCKFKHGSGSSDLCDSTAARNLMETLSRRSSISLRRVSSEQSSPVNLVSPKPDLYQTDLASQAEPSNKSQYSTTEFDYDDIGLSLVDFSRKFKQSGRAGLTREYEYLRCKNRPGLTRIAELYINSPKNRYSNILPYDHTRVVLKPEDLPDIFLSSQDPFDYVNACYIDGYRQPKAYISTQGPLQETSMDFWRMIWQTSSKVIVMFASVIENGLLKCHQYWPTREESIITEGLYKIEFDSSDWHDDFNVTRLRLTNTKLGETRVVWHLQYTSWPDFGTPTTASALLKFREEILKKQLDAIECTSNACYPPLVVHCSAGVGRTGTFITIDISIQKLETTGLVDIESVVDKLRYQRRDSIQTPDQYVFCYMAILEYAHNCGILLPEDD